MTAVRKVKAPATTFSQSKGKNSVPNFNNWTNMPSSAVSSNGVISPKQNTTSQKQMMFFAPTQKQAHGIKEIQS